jgi:hypothetical protein
VVQEINRAIKSQRDVGTQRRFKTVQNEEEDFDRLMGEADVMESNPNARRREMQIDHVRSFSALSFNLQIVFIQASGLELVWIKKIILGNCNLI